MGSVGQQIEFLVYADMWVLLPEGAQRSNGTRGGGNTSVYPGLVFHKGVIGKQRGKGGTSWWSSGKTSQFHRRGSVFYALSGN